MPDAPLLLTTAEVAKLLRVSRQTVLRWASTGLIKPVAAPGRNLRFHREDVDALVAPRSVA